MDQFMHIVNADANPHIVSKRRELNSRQKVDLARATHVEIVTLCGLWMIPGDSSSKLEVCGVCDGRATPKDCFVWEGN